MNRLFKKQTKNINFDSIDFNIDELVNIGVLKIDIKNQGDIYTFSQNSIDESLSGYDATQLENNLNKIWLGFNEKNFESMMLLGKKVFDAICIELSCNFKNHKFIVILSTDMGEYKNIVIRFYKNRGEKEPFIFKELDEYKHNGMLVAYLN